MYSDSFKIYAKAMSFPGKRNVRMRTVNREIRTENCVVTPDVSILIFTKLVLFN